MHCKLYQLAYKIFKNMFRISLTLTGALKIDDWKTQDRKMQDQLF